MKTTRLVVTRSKKEKYNGDILVYCVGHPAKKAPPEVKDIWPAVHGSFDFGDFTGKSGEKILAYPGTAEGTSHFQARRLAIQGLGKISPRDSSAGLGEKLRIAGGSIAGLAKEVRAARIMVVLPKIKKLEAAFCAQCLVEGILLADYQFLKYKAPDKKNPPYKGIREVKIYTDSFPGKIRKGVQKAWVAANAVIAARNMANEPGNKWTPQEFVLRARELAARYSMKCRVIEKEEMGKLKMGGLLAVSQGSPTPPKLVVLEYVAEREKAPTLLLAGKGLTFDSGGVSLKPVAGMQKMKYDMCGGAAVLSLMQAAGEERPDVNLIAVIPSTENMSGGGALKPGDIIRHYNGVTSEIINTDAEGRLVLADALAYGIEHFHPDCVIDIATLTGAVIVGLGHHYTGVLGNDDALVEELIQAGERSGEPLWRLPLGEAYSEQIESKVADIKNIGGKGAGTITGAAYLQKFVGKTPWAHLDIGGTAWEFTKKSYIPTGPSGVGVRLLLEFIRNWSGEKQRERFEKRGLAFKVKAAAIKKGSLLLGATLATTSKKNRL